VALFGRHGTDPAAAFLHGFREKHDLAEAVCLVDQFGYRTALNRLGLNGRVDYTDRNLIEEWFHTLKMRIDRFHTSWVGSRSSARELLEQFAHYYNHQRPHQSLDGRTPVEDVLNWIMRKIPYHSGVDRNLQTNDISPGTDFAMILVG
jgi:putative transposase